MKATASGAVWLLAAIPLLGALPSLARETLLLRPGFQAILERPNISRLSIGNPEIIEAQPLSRGGGVLVVGKKEGETDLVIWEDGERSEWHVEVRQQKTSLAEEVRNFARAFPGLTVTEAGDELIVSGTTSTAQDSAVLERYAKTHPGVHLRLSKPEENRSILQYDLKFIEINSGETKQFGIRWPDALPVKATLTSTSGNGRVITFGSDFEARLGLLLANGRARILSNPRLACESGEDALFLAGGEIPIVIITPETRTVEWKTYGIILRIRPTRLYGGKIRTQVTAEVSTVDHGSGTADVPGFLTRRVSTHFTTMAGETVMLSGLVKNEMAKDVSKVPLLGQIPVIGELFKSRSFRENQTELAVFITPEEGSEDGSERAAEWRHKAEDERKTVGFRLLD